VEICDKFYSWLTPGGQLFFDVIDLDGFSWAARAKMRVKRTLYPALPAGLKAALDRRERGTPLTAITQRELEEILRASRFSDFTVSSHLCDSPLWKGRHLECFASVSAHDLSGRSADVTAAIPNKEPERATV
jgi:hypothetical protein